MTPAKDLERIERFHGYDAWRGRRRMVGALHVLRFQLGGPELPGWKILSTRALEAPVSARSHSRRRVDAATTESLAAPIVTRTVWQSTTRSDVCVDLQLFECASKLAAEGTLIQILGCLQSPALRLRNDVESGDITFSTPGAGAVLTVRGNLVTVMRNVRHRGLPLLDMAQTLDAYVVKRPEVPVHARAVHEVDAAGLHAGDALPLATVTAEPKARDAMSRKEREPSTLKLFSSGGEVIRTDGGLVYCPCDPGRHEILCVAEQPDSSMVVDWCIPVHVE